AFVDDNMFVWEMEDEVVGELIADVFLKGEEFEEVRHVSCARPAKCGGISRTAGGSLAMSSTLKDLRIVGEAPVQSVDRQLIADELKQVMLAAVTAANRRSPFGDRRCT
ncbi:hypothetical protein HAX54_018202, partial [Datura stramonium]|nr:hypothetical protein [Datura stramonium]